MAAFGLLSVLATWPGVRTLSSRYIGSGLRDQVFIDYMLDWGYRSMLRGMKGFWDAPFYFPVERMTTYSDHALGLQIFFAPAMALSGAPLLAYNLVFLASMAFSGYAGFLLARHLTGAPLASFLAGCLLLLAPYKLTHSGHLHLLALAFPALTLLAVHRAAESPSVLRHGALAACYAMAFLTSFYHGFYLAVVLGALLVLGAALGIWKPARAVAALATLGVTLLLLFVTHLPLLETMRVNGLRRSIEENAKYSARPFDYLAACPGTLAALIPTPKPDVASDSYLGERLCYLGVVPLGLLAVAFVGRGQRPRWVLLYASLLGLTVVLSFGPSLSLLGGRLVVPLPYRLLYAVIPGFKALRVPARLTFFVALLMVPLVALGAMRILAPRRRGWRVPLAALAVAVHLIEAWLHPFPRSEAMPMPRDDVAYRRLAAPGERFAVCEIPYEATMAMYGAMYHGHAIVNGYTSHRIERLSHLRRLLPGFPSVATIAALRELERGGVRVERVIWRRSESDRVAFDRARSLHSPYPGAPLLDDLGDALVFGLRPREELFGIDPGQPGPVAYAPLPLDRFEVGMRVSRRDGEGLHVRQPGAVWWRVPVRRGNVCFRASVRASASGELPPPTVAIFLDEVELARREVPWGGGVTIVTPAVDCLVPGRYTLSISVECETGLRHPPMDITIGAVEMAR